MHIFKKIFLTSFFIFALQIGFAQNIVSYELSLSYVCLPGGSGKYEIYSFNNNKASHHAEEFHGKKIKHTSKNVKNDVHIKNTILQLDSLFQLTVFTFQINKGLIDSIKADNARRRYHKIPVADIDRFFSHGDTVTLDLKDIKRDSFEIESTVIDGCPYFFKLEINRTSKDTTIRTFQGNLFDHVDDYNIKNWLPVYLAYRQHPFLTKMPMDEYFTDESLKSVLMRFIEWNK